MSSFMKFPSIKRMKRECVITEKLDGTNSQINFSDTGEILCGSRNRIITPSDDNYGFANWAYRNQSDLFNILGEGRHYGEWWGLGIQRAYNMPIKMFSLFNTGRWNNIHTENVEQLAVVPVLYEGIFSTDAVDDAMKELQNSSHASYGFKNPEGVVVYHTQLAQMFKVTYENDDYGKST